MAALRPMLKKLYQFANPKKFYWLLAALAALAIGSGFVPPQSLGRPMVLLPLTLPGLLAMLALSLLFRDNRRPAKVLVGLLVLATGGYFYAPFRWRPALADHGVTRAVSVVTYNCRFFNSGHWFSNEYYDSAFNHRAWVAQQWLRAHPAEIKLCQEFFDDVNSSIFASQKYLHDGGRYQSYFVARPKHDNGLRFGLAIFSRYPIVGQGVILLSKNTYNGAIYVDLDLGQDTLRVINVHLESSRLGGLRNPRRLIGAHTRTALLRSAQADTVLAFVADSPHPVIVGGDFNETTFSYTYQAFAIHLKNAFQYAGNGWGTTFYLGGKLPLQIDHQFCSPSLVPINFGIDHSLQTSDHLPTQATYLIE